MHLTYHNPNENIVSASTASAGEAGAPEIEITPEMMKAGLSAWYDYDSRFESEEDGVRAIFVAMLEASLNLAAIEQPEGQS